MKFQDFFKTETTKQKIMFKGFIVWSLFWLYLIITNFNPHSIGIEWEFISKNMIGRIILFILFPSLLFLDLKKILSLVERLDYTTIKEKVILNIVPTQISKLLFGWTVVNILVYFMMLNNGIKEELKRDYFFSIFLPTCCPKECKSKLDVCNYSGLIKYYDHSELFIYVFLLWFLFVISLYVFKDFYSINIAKKLKE